MKDLNPMDIFNEFKNDKVYNSTKFKNKQNSKKKTTLEIPPNLLEKKYFEELGYQEFDKLYSKVIELFKSNLKVFDKRDLIRLAELIGDRCSIEAEAEHEAMYQKVYYEKMKSISELGLNLSKNSKGLQWNLGVACYSLEKYKQAINPFKNLLKIQSKVKRKEKRKNQTLSNVRIVTSTPLSYLASIHKKLDKINENKRVLRKLNSLLQKYKQN